jgi:hypothetical protein
VLLWACSSDSAHRAHTRVVKTGAKLNGFDPDRVRIVTDLDELAGATLLVEAVIKQHESKARCSPVSASWRDTPVPTPCSPPRRHPYRSQRWPTRAATWRTSSASTS